MKHLPFALLHFAVMTANLCGPGGVRAVIAESLVRKQQLIVLRRARRRAPNLTLGEERRSDGLLGERSNERRCAYSAPPVLRATALLLDSTGRAATLCTSS